jgi:hypothetical protein
MIVILVFSFLGEATNASAHTHGKDDANEFHIEVSIPRPGTRLCKDLDYSGYAIAWNGPDAGGVVTPVFFSGSVNISSEKGVVNPAVTQIEGTTGLTEVSFTYTPKSAGTDSIIADFNSTSDGINSASYMYTYTIEESCDYTLKEVSTFSEGDPSADNFFIDKISFFGTGKFGIKEDGQGGAELVVGSAYRNINRYFDTVMKGMHSCQLPLNYDTTSRFQIEGGQIEPPTYLQLIIYYDEVNFPTSHWKCVDNYTNKDETFQIIGRQWSEILQFEPETIDFRYEGGTFSPDPFIVIDGGVTINFNTVFTLTKDK